MTQSSKQTFEAKGRRIFFSNEPVDNGDGSQKITLGGPFCDIWEHLVEPEKVAEWLAKVLNERNGDA